jgi:hypothetical protein
MVLPTCPDTPRGKTQVTGINTPALHAEQCCTFQQCCTVNDVAHMLNRMRGNEFRCLAVRRRGRSLHVRDETSKTEAHKLWDAVLAELSVAAALDYPDDYLAPTVVTGDNRHFYVAFTFKKRSVWLPPDHARWLAEDLMSAAEEADAKMTHQARQEMYPLPDTEEP